MLLCRVSEGSNTANVRKNHRLIVRLAQKCFDRRNISRQGPKAYLSVNTKKKRLQQKLYHLWSYPNLLQVPMQMMKSAGRYVNRLGNKASMHSRLQRTVRIE